MIWPPLTSPTSSLTLCPSFTLASHSGLSGPERPNVFPTSGPLHLLFALPGMLFSQSFPQEGKVPTGGEGPLPQRSLLYLMGPC